MQVETPAHPAAAEPTVGAVRRILNKIHACDEAEDWFFNAGLSPREAWEACRRGDWLLWLCGQVGVDRRLLVRAACDAARPVLRFVPITDARPRRVLDMADRWGRGEVGVDRATLADDARAMAAGPFDGGDHCRAAWVAGRVARVADPANPDFAATLGYAPWYAADLIARQCGERADEARELALHLSAVTVRKRVDWPVLAAALVAFAGH